MPNSIEAFDAEEIGVEHLLRDVKDNTVSTLSTKVSEKLQSMRGLKARLEEIKSYMDKVVDGSLPMNHEIMGHLQNAFNLLPNLNLEEYVRGFNVSSNDAMLVIYLSSLIRSVIALHDLIKNKAENKERERAMDECAVKGAEGKENEKPEDGAEKTSDADAEKKKESPSSINRPTGSSHDALVAQFIARYQAHNITFHHARASRAAAHPRARQPLPHTDARLSAHARDTPRRPIVSVDAARTRSRGPRLPRVVVVAMARASHRAHRRRRRIRRPTAARRPPRRAVER